MTFLSVTSRRCLTVYVRDGLCYISSVINGPTHIDSINDGPNTGEF